MSEHTHPLTPDEMAEKLARWNRFRCTTLSRLNHDARSPLTTIMGFAELLLEEPLTEDQMLYAQRILDSCDQMISILDEFRTALKDYPPEPME